MKLIVHELLAEGLEQVLTPERNTVVEAVRPHIYRHNFAPGSLKVEIVDSDSNVVAESETIQISDIGTAPFFHGYVRFNINAGLKRGQQYRFRLVGQDGYEFTEESYIGWCNGFDLGKYETAYTPESSLNEPLDIEIWERTVK